LQPIVKHPVVRAFSIENIDSFSLLVKSIEEDGFTLPVIVNSGVSSPHLKDMIIDGEHRWRAAQVLGMQAVPVVYKDEDEAQMRTSTLRHNKARGHHDALLEAKVLNDLVGEIGVDELSSGLNLDPVELEVMVEKAKDFTSMQDLSALSEPELLIGLASQNLTGENAQIVAARHGMIDAKNVLNQQNSDQLTAEAGQSVRIELIYHGEDADFIRSVVAKHGSAHTALLYLCSER